MQHSLILLAGGPGTGKSYTGNIIRRAFPELTYAPLDLYKEHLYDEIGFDDLQQKDLLDAEARQRYFRALALMMQNGRDILGDYPFSGKQKPALQALSQTYRYQVITIRLEAPLDLLYQRQQQRDIRDPRHPGHLLTRYHLHNGLIRQGPLDGMPSYQVFKRRFEARGYDQFQLGHLIRVDVSDYAKISYPALLTELRRLL